MTLDEFDKTSWSAGMKAKYRGVVYDISSCNYVERLISLYIDDDGDDIWVRCENVEIVGARSA